MKLTDLDLTPAQAAAFVGWLQRLADAERVAREKVEAEREAEDRYTRWHEKLCDLARETARTNGLIEGLSPHYAAAATWEAFSCGEGWFSSYDVSEGFEATDDWRETWELAYVSEVERLKSGAPALN